MENQTVELEDLIHITKGGDSATGGRDARRMVERFKYSVIDSTPNDTRVIEIGRKKYHVDVIKDVLYNMRTADEWCICGSREEFVRKLYFYVSYWVREGEIEADDATYSVKMKAAMRGPDSLMTECHRFGSARVFRSIDRGLRRDELTSKSARVREKYHINRELLREYFLAKRLLPPWRMKPTRKERLISFLLRRKDLSF